MRALIREEAILSRENLVQTASVIGTGKMRYSKGNGKQWRHCMSSSLRFEADEPT